MSLKTFHLFFMTVSGALGIFMGVWGFEDYAAHGGGGSLALGVSGAVLLLLLIPYLRWFKIKMNKIKFEPVVLATIGMALSVSPSAQSCPMCYGDTDSLLTKGINGGILFLILVVGGVLGSILTVVISWVRRARSLKDARQGFLERSKSP